MSDELPEMAGTGLESSPTKESQPSPPATSLQSPEGESAKAAAYQSAMQSTMRAVEDTSEQLRRLAMLSTAASGVALRLMLAGEQPRQAAKAMTQAQQVLQQATSLFEEMSRVSTQLLESFQPPGAPPPASPAPETSDAAKHDKK